MNSKKLLKKSFVGFMALTIFLWPISPILSSTIAGNGDVLSRKLQVEQIEKAGQLKDFKGEEKTRIFSADESFKKSEEIKQPQKQNYVPGEVLVKFKERKINLENWSGRLKAENFAFWKGLEKKEDIRKSNISVLKMKNDESVEGVVERLKGDPDVEYVQPNFQYYPLSEVVPWGLEKIEIPEAWGISEGEESEDGVIVAVIDSGVAYNHPDLQANMWDGSACTGLDKNGISISGGCQHGYDYEDNDKIPLPTTSSHGTHIAGTIGAVKNNDMGIIGVAPNVKIMAIKSSLTSEETIRGINFAEQNGAIIINASWGCYGSDQGGIHAVCGTPDWDDHAMIGAIESFSGLFVTAAGNGDGDSDSDGDNHDSGQTLHSYPCDHTADNIICVAATDSDDNLANFSDYGVVSVDVGAPGVNIYSTISSETSANILNEIFEGTTPPAIPSGWIKGGSPNYWGTYALDDGSVWGKVLYGDYSHMPYENNVDSTVTLPSYNLNDATAATIDFWSKCDTEYFLIGSQYFWTDYMKLEISNDGVNFIELKKWNEAWIDSNYPDNAGSAAYHFQNLEIPNEYLTSNFKLRFRWITDSSNVPDLNYDGCLIDDVKITKYSYSDGSDEQYGFSDGTSMSAPHVAGLAALIWGYKSNLSYSEVKDTILSTGDDLLSLAGKTVTGKRINAFNALNSLIDSTPPIITLIGSSTINFFIGDNYIDEGATAEDDVDGDITGSIITTGLPIDTTATGTNIITYNVSDSAGNPAIEVIRTVIVSEEIDITPPVITLLGDNPVELFVDDDYTEYGATAEDNVDGNISGEIEINNNSVDISTSGTYEVTYNVSDSAGNPADEVTRTVNINEIILESLEITNPAAKLVYIVGEELDISGLEITGIYNNGTTQIEIITIGDITGFDSSAPITDQVLTIIVGEKTTTYTIDIIPIPDTTPPTLTETTSILTPTNNNTPNYTFSSDEAGTISYSGGCASDTVDAVVGDNTITFIELADSTYSGCQITVTDASDNTSAPLIVNTFTIDTIAPIVEITSPIDGLITNQNPVTLNWTVDGEEFSEEVILTEEGENTLTKEAADDAGNVGSDSITVILDTIAPTAALSNTPDDPTNQTTTDIIVGDEEVTDYRYSLDSGAYSEAEISVSEHIQLSDLPDGEHTISIIGRDEAGNWQDKAGATVYVWAIDTIAPVVEIISPEDGLITNQSTITVEYTIDGTPASDDEILSEGVNTVVRSEADEAGNTGSDSIAVILDATPPARDNGLPTGALSVGTVETTLSLTTDEDAVCRYATSTDVEYNAMIGVFDDTGSTTHSTLITGLTNGNAYSYYVKCQDELSNANTDDYEISFSVSNPTPVPACGDGACNGDETCSTCSTDCGPCPSSGGGGGSYSPPTSQTANNAPLQISSSQKGTLTQSLNNENKVKLEVPKGSVKSSVTFTAAQGSLTSDNVPKNKIGAFLFNGLVFNIEAVDASNNAVREFSEDLTITLTIPDLPDDISILELYYFDDENNEWIIITGIVFGDGTITFKVNHLTQFAVFEIRTADIAGETKQKSEEEVTVLGVEFDYRAIQLQQIATDANDVWTGDVNSVIANAGVKRDLAKEADGANKYTQPLTKGITGLTAENKNALTNFVVYGTKSTQILGAGERAGVINSYKSAFGKLPATQSEWEDVIKIANGRWPSETNPTAEEKAKTEFKKVYKRDPDMNNPNDNAAVTVIAYGLRPSDRNLDSEKAGIKTFKHIYGYNPISAIDWDIVRAIAYSGATR